MVFVPRAVGWGVLAVWLLLWFPVVAEPMVKTLEYADLLFKQKEYDKAAWQYHLFLKYNPSSEQAQRSWFQLGESYHQAGKVKEARAAYENLIVKYHRGPLVGEASYQVGMINFQANDFSGAAVDFELASREATAGKVKYQAKFYHARSWQLLQQNDKALALFEQLIGENPDPELIHLREKSILETARIFSEKGEHEVAHRHFDTLIQTAKDDDVREEAIVRSGMAAVLSGRVAEGETILKAVGGFRSNSPWKSAAEVGALFAAFTKEDYSRVIAIYSTGAITTTAGEYRPKVLFMVAEAFRILGQEDSASRLYTLLESRYPAEKEGIEAGFRRLNTLYRSNSGKLPSAVEKYAEAVKSHAPENNHIDKAWLMLAEWHFFHAERGVKIKDLEFAKNQYQLAGVAYQKVREDLIDAKLLPTKLYHQSWAALESSDPVAGIQAVTNLAERFPESPLVPQALAKRGEIWLLKEDFASAMRDFQAIIEKYPDSPSLELALDRKGRIYAHKRILPEMISAYEELLRRFPETRGRAEAHFWIGEGYFEQEMYRECIEHLETARDQDPEAFANKAGIRTIMAYYALKQVPEMTQAARIYIQSGRDAGVPSARKKTDKAFEIPEHVLVYLARKLSEKGEYEDALFFLERITTPTTPEKTGADVWKEWAIAKLHLKEYSEAITGFDYFLSQCREPARRGEGYLNQARAQFHLTRYEDARLSALECLRVVKQGRVNAEARILIGEIALQKGELEMAAREYDLVSQIFDDPEITSQALGKAAETYHKLGMKSDAARLEQKLADRVAEQNRRQSRR